MTDSELQTLRAAFRVIIDKMCESNRWNPELDALQSAHDGLMHLIQTEDEKRRSAFGTDEQLHDEYRELLVQDDMTDGEAARCRAVATEYRKRGLHANARPDAEIAERKPRFSINDVLAQDIPNEF
jgi:hypothetical protein